MTETARRAAAEAAQLTEQAIARADQPAVALALLRAAELKLALGSGGSLLSARIVSLIAYMLHRCQDLEGARAAFVAAEARWAAVPAAEGIAARIAMLSNYANLLVDLGDYDESAERLLAALDHERQIAGMTESPEHGRTLANYARLLNTMGQFPEATRHARRAVALLGAGTAPDDAISCLYAKTILAASRMGAGAWSEALSLLESILPAAKAAGARDLLCALYANIGCAFYGLGAFEKVVEADQAALDLLAHEVGPGSRLAEATVLTNLGAAYHKLEEFVGATALYAKAEGALRQAVPDGRHPEMALIAGNWGIALLRLGRFEEARERLATAIDLRLAFDGAGHPATADLRFHIAEIAYAMGPPESALEAAIETLALPGTYDHPDLLWRVFDLISRILAEQGRLRLAILFSKQAVSLIEGLHKRAESGGSTPSSFFTRSRAIGYRDLASHLLAESRVAEAERVLTRLGAAGEARLSGRETALFADSAPAFSRREEKWRTELAAAFQAITALRHRQERIIRAGFRDRARLLGARTKAAARLVAEVRALAARSAETASLERAVEPPTFGKGQFALRPSEILIEILPASDRLWVLRHELGRPVERLALDLPEASFNALVLQFRAVVSDATTRLAEVLALARHLYDRVLRPVLGNGPEPGRRLRIWAEGAARVLPFAALHTGNGYLMELAPLSLHSPLARGGGIRRGLKRHGVAGFALGRAIAGCAPLPGAQSEIEAVAGKAGAFPGECFVKHRFNRTALRRAIARFGGLLIASHFRLNPTDLARSGLVTGSGRLLPVHEILGLDLGGISLVTLSACETATPGLEEDLLRSLADGLLLRGTGAVLASLWHVADQGAAQLVPAFYAHLAQGDETDYAAALAAAQTGMARMGVAGLRGGPRPLPSPRVGRSAMRGIGGTVGMPEACHPAFWAPFVLVDGLPRLPAT
jgi:CHAT domain-containing protein/Tfp pilus assembly protein PilF